MLLKLLVVVSILSNCEVFAARQSHQDSRSANFRGDDFSRVEPMPRRRRVPRRPPPDDGGGSGDVWRDPRTIRHDSHDDAVPMDAINGITLHNEDTEREEPEDQRPKREIRGRRAFRKSAESRQDPRIAQFRGDDSTGLETLDVNRRRRVPRRAPREDESGGGGGNGGPIRGGQVNDLSGPRMLPKGAESRQDPRSVKFQSEDFPGLETLDVNRRRRVPRRAPPEDESGGGGSGGDGTIRNGKVDDLSREGSPGLEILDADRRRLIPIRAPREDDESGGTSNGGDGGDYRGGWVNERSVNDAVPMGARNGMNH